MSTGRFRDNIRSRIAVKTMAAFAGAPPYMPSGGSEHALETAREQEREARCAGTREERNECCRKRADKRA